MINMMGQPLRYQISQWPQAAKCLSNNSRNLYITINDFIQNDSLKGMIIKVEHAEFGVLFAAVIKGEGQLVTKYDTQGNYIPWMSTSEILQQLKKFGFEIMYNEISSLDDSTLDQLMQIRDLGYDKINQIVVISRKDGVKISKTYTVAFRTKGDEDILVYGIPITETKFNNRLSSGKMISLNDTDIDWEWVTSVYNIEDILQENADIEKFHVDALQQEPVTILNPTIEIPQGFTLYDETESDQEE